MSFSAGGLLNEIGIQSPANFANHANPLVTFGECLLDACKGITNIECQDLIQALAAEDIDALGQMANPLPFLQSFALALSSIRWRKSGIAPPGWTHIGHCERCGPVYLWAAIQVAGCPWCWNRRHDLPIPRPLDVTPL